MDLATIFPSIRFENEHRYPKTGVKDNSLMEVIKFKSSYIFSSLVMHDLKDRIPIEVINEIDRVKLQIIDSNGASIEDFSIVYDTELKSALFKSNDSDAVQIFSYFNYIKKLDHHNPIDFIKIQFSEKRGGFILLNNEIEMMFGKYLYMNNQPSSNYFPLYFEKDYDEPIIQTLEYLSKSEKELYKNILTAITLFNQACRISKFSQKSAIVLITSALEALLQIPRIAKKDNFSFAFKLFWGFNKRIEEWAAQLYELRNQIVHGAVVDDKKLFVSTYEHYNHFNIGREIFHSTLLVLLDIKGVIDVGRDFRIDETRTLLNKVISNKEKIDIIIKAKKKYSYYSFKKNIKYYREFILRIEGLTSIDYSARKQVFEVIKLIFDIMKDWIDELVSEKNKNSENPDFSNYSLERWKNIQNHIDKFNSTTWTDTNKYSLKKLIENIEDELRKLYPIVHNKKEFKFNLSEFGSRCFAAIWATY